MRGDCRYCYFNTMSNREAVMIVATLLAFAIGIGLAQFFRVFVLIPTTLVGTVATWLHQTSGGCSRISLAIGVLIAASAAQSGFPSGTFLGGYMVQGKRPYIAAAPRDR
jgi:hypothetical protein